MFGLTTDGWKEIDSMLTQKVNKMRCLILLNLIWLGLMLLFASQAHAESVIGDLPIRAILGEALHDQQSMNIMAHAIKNRVAKYGSFKGIYGAKVSMGEFDQKTRQKASDAWEMAFKTEDMTKGATHWLSDYDLKHCKKSLTAFRFRMTETLYQGQTHYYKELT